MNIVYLLTNKTKTSGKRYYIGSKSECKIVEINGIKTMISTKTGKPYMSSSTSYEFKDDIKQGHVFEASVLEEVSDKNRSRLIEVENNWIIKHNAVDSDEFYNLSYAVLNMRIPDRIANRYGQTVSGLAKDNSNMSKRDGTAKQLGYSNYGEFCFDAYRMYKECGNWAEVSRKYNKYKNFARISLAPFDMEKAIKDLEHDRSYDIRKLMADNCSLAKACEILDIELPAGRKMLGDFLQSREFSVATNLGKSKKELEITVTKMILDGKGFREVSNELGIVYESVKRYFFRCIRERLKSSDL